MISSLNSNLANLHPLIKSNFRLQKDNGSISYTFSAWVAYLAIVHHPFSNEGGIIIISTNGSSVFIVNQTSNVKTSKSGLTVTFTTSGYGYIDFYQIND